jgi:SSS family solute:Na+ symporter
LEDRELGYPLLMLEFLPPFLLGLVVASLIAAFMSTVSTLINWGASYLTNDSVWTLYAPRGYPIRIGDGGPGGFGGW